ncbi:MAG: hypothetical protein PHI11_09910, partial [Gallionella sp.]|nr:hypothetical protein [Gallionella sp.]
MAQKREIFSIEDADDCPTEIQEQLQKQIDAFEQASWCSSFQTLIESGLPIRLVHPLFASGYMQKGEDDNPTGHRIARDKLVQLHSRRYP